MNRSMIVTHAINNTRAMPHYQTLAPGSRATRVVVYLLKLSKTINANRQNALEVDFLDRSDPFQPILDASMIQRKR